MSGFGYEYPAGAADDPNAPYNEQICEVCECVVDSLDEEGICNECINNADTDNYCEEET